MSIIFDVDVSVLLKEWATNALNDWYMKFTKTTVDESPFFVKYYTEPNPVLIAALNNIFVMP